MSPQARQSALATLIGDAATSKIQTSKVLLVGAGGIGCELLKEIVLAGFGEVHLVDLDTIDLSNLNRQFLFSQQHIKQSKAKVAKQVAGEFNPNVNIVAYQDNIMAPGFSPRWFASFDVAFNALDNAEARKHVNKMCVATDVPLVDCGTAGFEGQVQVIIPRKTECYACRTHPTPKAFPVCTIRSTPSQPIHCVVWAKSYLFSQVFGHDDQEAIDDSETGDNKQELANLRREQNELADLRRSVNEPGFVEKMTAKVFISDIERLAAVESMWKNRPAPEPLQVPDYSALDGAAIAEEDQRDWTLAECMAVLASSTKALASRLKGDEALESLEFDKDDEDALNFVSATTNIRAYIFGLPLTTKFAIKQMAGNIIPAIATTNAIVSGMGVVEAIKLVAGLDDDLRSVNIWRSQDRVLSGEKLAKSDPECVVSGVARTTLTVEPATKLETVLEDILKEKLGYSDVSLVTDRLIYDPDYEDNLSQTLAQLGLDDAFVTVIDEDDKRVNLELYVVEGDKMDIEEVGIPDRVKPKAPALETLEEIEPVAPKRSLEDADVDVPTKKPAANDGIVDMTVVDLVE